MRYTVLLFLRLNRKFSIMACDVRPIQESVPIPANLAEDNDCGGSEESSDNDDDPAEQVNVCHGCVA